MNGFLITLQFRCYLRLSDNQRACEALCQCLPDQLRDNTFEACLKEDKSTKHWLSQLLKNLDNMGNQQSASGGAGTGASGSAAGGGTGAPPPGQAPNAPSGQQGAGNQQTKAKLPGGL